MDITFITTFLRCTVHPPLPPPRNGTSEGVGGWLAAPFCWREMSGQNSVMQNIKLLNYIRIHPSHSTVYVADMSCAVLIASFLSFFVQHRPPSTSLARFTSQAPSIARCDHCCAFASEWPRIVRRWLSY